MTDDLDRRIAASWRTAAGIADKMFGDGTSTARVSRAVADTLDPPEPEFESMERCIKDAKLHCIEQAGGGWILYGTGLSTWRLQDKDRNQALKVVAEILYAERNRREVPHD